MTTSKITALYNAKLILEEALVEDKILLFNDKIVGIVDDIIMQDSDHIEMIDAKGAYVSAGFIDLHIHGSGGVDVMDATPQALERLSGILPSTGTTSFLATTMTMPPKVIKKALENVKIYGSSVRGAEILGIHLEGPYINPDKHGAQDKAYIQLPNMALIEPYMNEVKMITLAPEIAGSETFIKYLQESYPHIILSIGHSTASYEESLQSFRWGISHATHLFNAMNPYHHRNPGIVGAVFDTDVTCDIIADRVHTHTSILALVHKMKKEKLMLITDAMRAGCMQGGIYDLGGQTVKVAEGKALLNDGTLAGSVLQMNKALHTMTTYTSMSLIEAVRAVTQIPAQKLGISKGILKVGYDADIVMFNEDFEVLLTLVAGEVKYQRELILD
jgi:N-acetylglucosamine-6-phosphate deacetylase